MSASRDEKAEKRKTLAREKLQRLKDAGVGEETIPDLDKCRQALLRRNLDLNQRILSPLKNRPQSVVGDFTPCRTDTYTCSYGDAAFHRRYSRRDSQRAPLPGAGDPLCQLGDSHLFRRNRDLPTVDERRVRRAPSLLPGESDRTEGLNGEGYVRKFHGMRSSDATTRFDGTTQDPRGLTQIDMRKANHRLVWVSEGRSGLDVKTQLRDQERQRRQLTRESGGAFVPPGLWTGFDDHDI